MSNFSKEALAFAVAFLVFTLLLVLFAWPTSAMIFSGVAWSLRPYIAVIFGFCPPVALALLTWRSLRRKLRLANFRPQRRSLQATVLALYLCTAVFGIPSVHTELVRYEIAEYKHARNEGRRVWPAHPRIEFFFSCPILPFVIITYHEYQLAGLYGWGGWEFHLWYIVGAKSITGLSFWVS